MISHRRFADTLIAQLPALRRFAVALVGDATLADDLVQDSIERALRQWGQLRDLAHMASWLRRILRNLYIDGLRRNRHRGREQDISELADELQLSVAPADGGSLKDLASAVQKLSVEHREILLLVSVEGLNYHEVSEELGIPMGTVMSRLARARSQLRTLIEDGAIAPVAKLGKRS